MMTILREVYLCLQTALVVLKLVGHLSCSWWWVLSPLWATPIIALVAWAIIMPSYSIISEDLKARREELEYIKEKEKKRCQRQH